MADGDVQVPGLPDLVIIGAMKAATSSLHVYLGAHPAIAVSRPKELDFFLEHRFGSLGVAWYRDQFWGRPGAQRWVEASPNYTKAHGVEHGFGGVPARMASVIPGAKLVYVVRDPFDRIASEYRHVVASGNEPPGFSAYLRSYAGQFAIRNSCYDWQLRQYEGYYAAEQIRVIDQVDIRDRAGEVVNGILEWLGLPGGFEDPIFTRQVHQGSQMQVAPNRLGRLVWRSRRWRGRFQRHAPWLVGSKIEPAVWSDEDRALVAEQVGPDAAALRARTGLALASWKV